MQQRDLYDGYSCVYFIYDPASNLIKIGVTDNLKERLRELKAQFGGQLQVVFTIPGKDYKLERFLHARFRKYRFRYKDSREWFYNVPAIWRYIRKYKRSSKS